MAGFQESASGGRGLMTAFLICWAGVSAARQSATAARTISALVGRPAELGRGKGRTQVRKSHSVCSGLIEFIKKTPSKNPFKKTCPNQYKHTPQGSFCGEVLSSRVETRTARLDPPRVTPFPQSFPYSRRARRAAPSRCDPS